MLAGSSEPSKAGEIERSRSAKSLHNAQQWHKKPMLTDENPLHCKGFSAQQKPKHAVGVSLQCIADELIGEALRRNITVPPTLVGSRPVFVWAGGSHLVDGFERAATFQGWIHEYNHHRSGRHWRIVTYQPRPHLPVRCDHRGVSDD
jgi:hypothetical protein